MSDAVCQLCAAGMPDFCENPQESAEGYFVPCGVAFAPVEVTGISSGGRGRPIKSPHELTNDVSAGRKRAAQLAPIMTGMVCEWAGLKHAGGGVIPIMGCRDTTIADVKRREDAEAMGAQDVGHRHHGPDKAVLNNSVGQNLHRVCSTCHNRWHAANDPLYGTRPAQDRPFVPTEPYYAHDPFTTYTEEERQRVEVWWALPVNERGEYPFMPPETTRKLSPVDTTTTHPLPSGVDPFA